jgi:hypothetical protein
MSRYFYRIFWNELVRAWPRYGAEHIDISASGHCRAPSWLGPDHPDTATSLNNLAIVLRDQEDLEGARALQERALAIREARLGPDHPSTVRSQQAPAGVVSRVRNQRRTTVTVLGL